jgi:ribokinase
VGSLNHDLTIWVPHLPAPDETLLAHRLAEFRGGKGANQATAAARAGGRTAMVGAVGADARGEGLVAGLAADGVDVRHVRRLAGVPTGVAVPVVADTGDVTVTVVAGANAALTPAHVEAAADVLAGADVLLLQGEVPAAAAARAAELARAGGVLVLLNPAPVNEVAAAVLPLADVVVVNRDEAVRIGAVPPSAAVVTTLGAGGVQVGDAHVPAFPATVVDPTGAGDAFCGALAVALAEGRDLVAAARFGAAAGACAVAVAGAEPSMPTRAAIEAVLRRT